MFSECPGTKNFKRPEPDYINCPHCLEELEIWSDEFQAKCPKCKKIVIRNQEKQTCLDWCKSAKECVGEAFYHKYVEIKKKKERLDGK